MLSIQNIRDNQDLYLPEVTIDSLHDYVMDYVMSNFDDALYDEIDAFTGKESGYIVLDGALMDERSFTSDIIDLLMTQYGILWKDNRSDDLFFGRNMFAVLNAFTKKLTVQYYDRQTFYETIWEEGVRKNFSCEEDGCESSKSFFKISFEI